MSIQLTLFVASSDNSIETVNMQIVSCQEKLDLHIWFLFTFCLQQLVTHIYFGLNDSKTHVYGANHKKWCE